MRHLFFLIIFSITFLSPGSSWEARSNVYSAEEGTVKWTPENFAGFYLDLNEGLGSESLVINLSNGIIKAGSAVYESRVQKAKFEHDSWGRYFALCFLGQKYFAGYSNDCKIAQPWNSLADNNIISRILIDSNERKTIRSNEPYLLEEGYSLRLSDDENGVKITLYKGSSIIDTKVLTPPASYIYSVPIGGHNTTLIALSLKANVKLMPQSFYSVDGLFQISEDITPIKRGAKYGEMELVSIGSEGITLANSLEFSLLQERDLEFLDGIYLKTIKSNGALNHIYIYKNMSHQGKSIIRGEVAAGSFTWSPQNFAGFYYDFNENIGKEMLTATITGSNTLSGEQANRGLIYDTRSQTKKFKYNNWGYYDTIAFMGKSFFAGYVEDSQLGQSSMTSHLLGDYNRLATVAIDSAESQKILNGETLVLKGGYEAKLYLDKSCNKAMIELYRNGSMVDRDYFNLPNTYVYREKLRDIDEITLLMLHLADVNCSLEKACLVDGIFQISEELVDLKLGSTYGIMSITGISDKGIRMENKGNDLYLRSNEDHQLMDEFHIKSGGAEVLKYYIYR